MHHLIRHLLPLFACLALAGCLPESEHPLSDPSDGFADERLYGVWVADRSGDRIVLHFGSGKNGKVRAAEVDHEKGGGIHASIYEVFSCAIGGVRYLNIRVEGAADGGYYFARYGVDSEDVLRIWLMSPEPVEKAITAGDLAGKVENSGGSKSIRIAAPTAKLAKFVAGSDRTTLFAEAFGEFRRTDLKPATKPAAKPATRGE